MLRSSTKELEDESYDGRLRRITHLNAVEGKELYEWLGGAIRVVESTSTAGRIVAVKSREPRSITRTDADMMHYAATHGVCAPKVLGLYKIKTTKPSKTVATTLVSERVPGVPLENVWLDLSTTEQSSIKMQLRVQFQRMRQCTQPFVGRMDNQELPNLFARFANTTTCGPFQDERSFDSWCMNRLLTRNPMTRFKWHKKLASERRHSSGRFVLTHGDLSPANIMVDKGIVTGIIDWDRSGFYPEYAEYAFAIGLWHNYEDWWREVLKEVLQPCSLARLEFTYLVQDKVPEEDWRKELILLRDGYIQEAS